MQFKTKILKSSKKNILETVLKLKSGEVIGLPTETVYGLAGRCDNKNTIENIYKIKNRPKNNPLIIHYSNSYDALKDIFADSRAIELAKNFWPGPLSIVAKIKSKSINKAALANLKTVAVRVPSNYTLIFKLNSFTLT